MEFICTQIRLSLRRRAGYQVGNAMPLPCLTISGSSVPICGVGVQKSWLERFDPLWSDGVVYLEQVVLCPAASKTKYLF